MKRVISFVLTAIMLCVSIPFSVSAIDGVTEDGLCYSVLSEQEEVHIIGYEGNDTVVTIPNEIEGYPVTTIGANSFESKSITEVNFPDTLKCIERYAFRYCHQLKTLIFPDSLEIIEEYSFEGCYAIEELFIPKSVAFFTSYVFTHGLRDAEITVDSENPHYYSVDNCVISKDTKALLVAGICDSIPEGVEIISGYAFASSDNLDVLEIPSTVTFIGEYAFFSSTLREIVISDGVEYIGSYAFGSSCLESINISDSVMSIGAGAFDKTYIKKVKLPQNIEIIREFLFSYCMELEEVIIPQFVSTIEADAFRRCNNLKTIYYSGSEDDWNSISMNIDTKSILDKANKVFDYVYAKSGDLDGDGEISANDALIMRKYLAKMILEDDINVDFADMNGDGRINAKDQFELRKLLAA